MRLVRTVFRHLPKRRKYKDLLETPLNYKEQAGEQNWSQIKCDRLDPTNELLNYPIFSAIGYLFSLCVYT